MAASFGQSVYGATTPRADAKDPNAVDPWNTSVSAGFYDGAGNFTPNVNYNQQTGGYLWGPDAGPKYSNTIAPGAPNYPQPAGAGPKYNSIPAWQQPGFNYDSYYTKGQDAAAYTGEVQRASSPARPNVPINPVPFRMPTSWNGPNGTIQNVLVDPTTGKLRSDYDAFIKAMGITSGRPIATEQGWLVNSNTNQLEDVSQYIRDTKGQLDSDYYNELLGNAQGSQSQKGKDLAGFLGGISPNTTLTAEQQQGLIDRARAWQPNSGMLGNIQNQLDAPRGEITSIPEGDFWFGATPQTEDQWRAVLKGNFDMYAPVLDWYSSAAPTGPTNGGQTATQSEANAATGLGLADLNTLLAAMGSMYNGGQTGGAVNMNAGTSGIDPNVLAMLMSGISNRNPSQQQPYPYGMGPNAQPMSSYQFTY